jgi:hypothetical protein
LDQLSADYRVVLHLKDEAGHIRREGGQEILDADYRRPSAWVPGDWTDQTFQLTLPPALPPGNYTVELGVFDPISRRRLSAWDATDQFAGLSLNLDQVVIVPPSQPLTPWDVVMDERYDPPLTADALMLLGQDPPPSQVASGDRTSFDLFWQAAVAPTADYTLSWRLSSSAGEFTQSATVPLSPHPTSRWRVQELEQVRYDLPIPPELPAGDYILFANVLAVDGIPLWPQDLSIAAVEILAQDRLFSLPPDIAYPLDYGLGNMIRLRGFDLLKLSASPGDQLPLTLYWQAIGPTDLSYSIFVHLVGPDGQLYGQVDRPPLHGAAPTHTWAPGQVVIDDVSLPVLGEALPGTYHIAVGFYDPNSGDRLPTYDTAEMELPNRQIVLPVEIRIE